MTAKPLLDDVITPSEKCADIILPLPLDVLQTIATCLDVRVHLAMMQCSNDLRSRLRHPLVQKEVLAKHPAHGQLFYVEVETVECFFWGGNIFCMSNYNT